jgi:hypothetical protein
MLWANVNSIPIETTLLEDADKLKEIINKLPVVQYEVDKSKLEQIQK